MKNKQELISNLFEEKEIRSIWDSEKEDYYFSVVDVIEVLTESVDASHYWRTLKSRMIKEGNETVTKCDTFKLKAKDGKMRNTDMLNTEGVLRLIESVPSSKAEPFKMWLASLGKREIDSAFDPSVGIDKMIDYYLNKGYSLSWIKDRIDAIIDRKKLTNTWKNHGIEEASEYAILTNEIYKTWSGMTAREYKQLKGIRKESLRDNMSDLEKLLTNIGEVATRELTNTHHPMGLEQNKLISEVGGSVANNTRKDLEKKLGKKVVSSRNKLINRYEK
ncbi:MAG: Bro-N domain-containing protein [Bacilli bacterium]|nr:Bro-N domain-containing protein [Bacilli bacterium]